MYEHICKPNLHRSNVRKSFKYVSFEVFSNESVHLLNLSHCEMVLPVANNTCNIMLVGDNI